MCWRGYTCHYEVAGQSLLLQHVSLWQRRDDVSETETEQASAPTLFDQPPAEFERKIVRLPEPRPRKPREPSPSRTPTLPPIPRVFEQQRLLFKNLGAPMPFTGGLLLARDFVERLYVHMGVHPAWKFRTVHELIFQQGRLVSETDCSERMERVREKMTGGPIQPGVNASEETIKTWIEGCFSLDY